MKRITSIVSAAALLIANAAFLSSCEDSPLTAGTDATIILIAQPETVFLDPANNINSATTRLIATVLSAEGVPQSGITVNFFNEAGTLASGSSGINTNSSGAAIDTLTVTGNDPDTFDVRAVSGALSESITITKSTGIACNSNSAPTARIAGAATQQLLGPVGPKAFSVDGSLSDDQETLIDKYIFTCGNGVAPVPGGGDTAQVTCTFDIQATPRTYTVSLQVRDQGNGVQTGGSYECAKTSTAATIQVVVTATQ
jgi:hypothetical protein